MQGSKMLREIQQWKMWTLKMNIPVWIEHQVTYKDHEGAL